MHPPDANKRTIWFDLDNSPHVPLFVPIIRHYIQSGIEVIITARDHAQTIDLLELSGLHGKFNVIGRHYGTSKINKAFGLFVRATQLASFIRKTRSTISVAVSHGSRSMVLAARWLGIPVITMYDYEHTETSIFNRFSKRVLVPDQIPDAVLNEIGLSEAKRVKYPGIKEELYLRGFEADARFRDQLFAGAVDSGEVLAVLRPPATTANYHAVRSDELFSAVLGYMLDAEHVFTVIVPRDDEQMTSIKSAVAAHPSGSARSMILEHAVDGLQLLGAADLVISGGGTMNREAMLLDTPVYSIFAGKMGALDAAMEQENEIIFVRTIDDIGKIRLERRDPAKTIRKMTGITDRVERCVIEQINSFLNND